MEDVTLFTTVYTKAGFQVSEDRQYNKKNRWHFEINICIKKFYIFPLRCFVVVCYKHILNFSPSEGKAIYLKVVRLLNKQISFKFDIHYRQNSNTFF